MRPERPRYEPALADAAEAESASRYPGFDPDGAFARLRQAEYGRLDRAGQVYLDYTGGGLYAAGQVEAHAALLRARVLGNPHSNNPTSLASSELLELTRSAVCDFFHAPREEYLCVFTANASAALRLVGESYPFAAGGLFALTTDNHNSVNGIREFARRKGAQLCYVPVTAPELRIDRAAMSRVLRAGGTGRATCWPSPLSRTSPGCSTTWTSSTRRTRPAGTCSSTPLPTRRPTRSTSAGSRRTSPRSPSTRSPAIRLASAAC